MYCRLIVENVPNDLKSPLLVIFSCCSIVVLILSKVVLLSGSLRLPSSDYAYSPFSSSLLLSIGSSCFVFYDKKNDSIFSLLVTTAL